MSKRRKPPSIVLPSSSGRSLCQRTRLLVVGLTVTVVFCAGTLISLNRQPPHPAIETPVTPLKAHIVRARWGLPNSSEELRQMATDFLQCGPRVGGASTTAGYQCALAYIRSYLATYASNWDVTLDTFSEHVAALGGEKRQFTNVIATWKAPRKSRPLTKPWHVVLAAHWDSKLMPFNFVGAMDSAIPTMMLLLFARGVAQSKWQGDADVSRIPDYISLMFFDGEEAFLEWENDDHTYGSRHLAKQWEQRASDVLSPNFPLTSSQRDAPAHNTISLFVLLDLMGPAGIVFHDFYASTSDQFARMCDTEASMFPPRRPDREFFPRGNLGVWHRRRPMQTVDDDHAAWVARGVPVLHLIPLPFPDVWHTARDTLDVVDFDESARLLHIIAQSVMSSRP